MQFYQFSLNFYRYARNFFWVNLGYMVASGLCCIYPFGVYLHSIYYRTINLDDDLISTPFNLKKLPISLPVSGSRDIL